MVVSISVHDPVFRKRENGSLERLYVDDRFLSPYRKKRVSKTYSYFARVIYQRYYRNSGFMPHHDGRTVFVVHVEQRSNLLAVDYFVRKPSFFICTEYVNVSMSIVRIDFYVFYPSSRSLQQSVTENDVFSNVVFGSERYVSFVSKSQIHSFVSRQLRKIFRYSFYGNVFFPLSVHYFQMLLRIFQISFGSMPTA